MENSSNLNYPKHRTPIQTNNKKNGGSASEFQKTITRRSACMLLRLKLKGQPRSAALRHGLPSWEEVGFKVPVSATTLPE